jgi:hypothetical protein
MVAQRCSSFIFAPCLWLLTCALLYVLGVSVGP